MDKKYIEIDIADLVPYDRNPRKNDNGLAYTLPIKPGPSIRPAAILQRIRVAWPS